MPFRSKAQNRYFFANPEKLGGIEKVMEWAHKTDFKHLPERASSKRLPPPRRTK